MICLSVRDLSKNFHLLVGYINANVYYKMLLIRIRTSIRSAVLSEIVDPLFIYIDSSISLIFLYNNLQQI